MDRTRQRQSEVRAVLFQAEQFVQAHQDAASASQRDRLHARTVEVRERLDRVSIVHGLAIHVVVNPSLVPAMLLAFR